MNKKHCIESLKDLTTHCYVATVDLETIQYAIKSIEAGDRTIEEIENYDVRNNFSDCSLLFKLGVTRGLDLAVDILKKHMGEEDKQCQM